MCIFLMTYFNSIMKLEYLYVMHGVIRKYLEIDGLYIKNASFHRTK